MTLPVFLSYKKALHFQACETLCCLIMRFRMKIIAFYSIIKNRYNKFIDENT